jgi:hypothetical protein
MSVLIRDLHNKYIIDFNTTNNDLVVYEYHPATFSMSEGDLVYSIYATHSYRSWNSGTSSVISGSWYDTTSQTTTANTPTPMYCNSIDHQNGIIKKFGSNFEVQYTGRYNLQFSIQLDQASGAGEHIIIWFRKNGVDIPWSASEVAIQGTSAETIPSWNYLFDLQAGDYVQVMYSVSNTNVFLKHQDPNSVPGIPSVIITMWKL